MNIILQSVCRFPMKIPPKNKTACILALLFILCSFGIKINASELAQTETEAFRKSKIWREKDLSEAVDSLTEAGNQRVILKDFEKASDDFLQAGKIYLQLGKKENARVFFEKARVLARKYALKDKHLESLGELALWEIDQGNLTKCLKYLEDAEKSSTKSISPKVSALIFFAKSEANYYRREFSKASENLKKAVELVDNSEFAEDKGQYLLNLGYAYIALDDRASATASFYRALEVFKAINNVRGEIFTNIALGYVHSNYYEKQKSIDLYRQAENLFVEDLDLDKKAMLYNGLGRVYMDFGEWQNALEYKNKAFDLYKRTGNKFGIVATLSSISMLNTLNEPENKIGNLQNFESAYQYAKSVKEDFYASVILQETGNYFFRLNDFDNALANYERSLPYFQGVKDKREISRIYSQTAQIFLLKKEYTKARKRLVEALRLNYEIEDRISIAESLYLQAKLDSAENKNSESLNNIKKSVQLTESINSEVANSKLKQSYLSNVFDRYEFYINLLMKTHKESSNEDFVIEALKSAERSRAQVMLEKLSLSEADFTKDADAETVRREKEISVHLNAKADKLTDLLSQNASKTETDKISGEISKLENELENIRATLKQQSPLYSAIKNPAPFDLGEFQQNVLDENSMLLEFSFGQEESYLWLIGKNSLNSYVLPSREKIEAHIGKLREILASREMKKDETLEEFQKRIAEAENLYQDESKVLSNQLFGQIADKLQNKRLIIVPDGKLHYFPVSALTLPNSEANEPILLTNETVYAPSAQTLLLLEKSKRQPSETAKNLLIFSDPVFTADDTRIPELSRADNSAETVKYESFRFVESLNSLQRLTASKNESDSILDIIGASNADSFSGFGANREQLLKTNTENYKIIHFATHGKTDEKHPELSGIILSRFDEKGQKLNEFIRIHDIYGLKLNTDLVVLSACETGVGKEVKGEGLMSLNNAFLQSGSKTVMASLWKVEDNATQELMKNFYRGMVDEKLTPSQSLRQAQIELRKNSQFKSPFYWAAFTVQGDFRNVPKISKSFGNQMYLFSLIPIIMVGFYLFRKRKIFLRRSS